MNDVREVAGVPGTRLQQVDSLPGVLVGGVRVGPHVTARPGALLVDVPRVARYLVRDGVAIDYCVEPDADPGAVELFLNGVARGALLHQRGELPLHAASLVPPESTRALALCGHSGVGKSTLAVELSRRGWRILADDTTRVTWTAGEAIAWPGNGLVKVWQDACDAFQMDSMPLQRVREELDKFYVPLPVAAEPASLALVIELLPRGGPVEEVTSNAEKMRLLTENTFRPRQIQPLGRMEQHLRIVAQIAGSCRVARIHGARILPVAELADRVEEAARCAGLSS